MNDPIVCAALMLLVVMPGIFLVVVVYGLSNAKFVDKVLDDARSTGPHMPEE